MKKSELIRKLEAAQMANASLQHLLNAMDNDNSQLKSIIARLTSENEKLTDKLNREIIKNKDIKEDYKRMGELCDSREKEHAKEVLKLRRELDEIKADNKYKKELEQTKAIAEKYRKLAVENYEKIMQLQYENPTDEKAVIQVILGFNT